MSDFWSPVNVSRCRSMRLKNIRLRPGEVSWRGGVGGGGRAGVGLEGAEGVWVSVGPST